MDRLANLGKERFSGGGRGHLIAKCISNYRRPPSLTWGLQEIFRISNVKSTRLEESGVVGGGKLRVTDLDVD